MFKFLIGLILVFAAFGGAFYAGQKESERIALSTPTEKRVFFAPSSYPLVNRSFVIVVTGYNNGAYVEKTLRSIFSQKYDSYRVVYVDDASDDGSFALARDLIYEQKDFSRFTLVQNEQRLGFLANLFRAVQGSADDEIVIPVNGEDWLAHEWVLGRLNQYYANPNVWLTYGQYREYPHYTEGYSRPISFEKGSIRNHPFSSSQPKSFYAALFKKISESDFIHQGVFYPAAGDLAYFLPLMEMGRQHAAFIDEIHYIANRAAPLKEERDLVLYCEKEIRSLTSYAPLTNLFEKKEEM